MTSVTTSPLTEADLARIVAARSAALQAAMTQVTSMVGQPSYGKSYYDPDDIMGLAEKYEAWILRETK